jgi:hypothetical protein
MNVAQTNKVFAVIPAKVFLIVIFYTIFAVSGVVSGQTAAQATEVDLTKAVVVAPANLSSRENKAVTVLVEEIEKRTQIRLPRSASFPTDATPVISVLPSTALKNFAGSYAPQVAAERGANSSEGYRIRIEKGRASAPAVFVIGNDERGVLFGVGHLLRILRMTKGKITVPQNFSVTTAPKYSLRGHQLGYRPKTNSYDAFTLPMWEQYIRDLAVFGTNAIELIPPRSDDDADSPHFPIPQMEMMVGMSRVIDEYGLDAWIWYPAMDKDYSDPKTVEFALNEWGEVFKKLPRVDAVFVPGGDPGHTQPKYLMALLEKESAVLHKYHPKAQMWVAPQGFNKEWMDEFYAILDKEQPTWLNGIVFGPQVRDTLPKLRATVSKKYPIRHYPDITHSFSSQYSVPDWDLAYPLTEAREVINPRPLGEAQIFKVTQPLTMGFLTYSEGVNDDVNKIVWSSLGWNPDADVKEILKQYSRYFIAGEFTDDFAEGLLGLERNWQGPLMSNGNVEATLNRFQTLERAASPQTLLNWRFQQALYRAYYDAFVKSRLIQETAAEELANQQLRKARRAGSLNALAEAERILDKCDTDGAAPELRARVFELGEALYQSVRMQLSTERYKGQPGRGANLDTIDTPLNNRRWLELKFAEARLQPDEASRLKAINEIVNWTNPGPGGFYDDLGNPARQPHLINVIGFDKDPGFMESAFTGFGYRPEWRRSWFDSAETAFDTPLRLRYTDLDPSAQYKVRVVYAGTTPQLKIRLVANDQYEIHPLMAKPSPVKPIEFDVPAQATASGELNLTWNIEPGRGGNGRGRQVSEIWLIKK